MDILKNKPTRNLVIAMVALVGIALIVSKIYYSGVNASNDPRITRARNLYETYNSLASEGNQEKIFSLLDSIEDIYSKTPHYSNSFEVGVLYNNRAAVYLTSALHNDSITADSLFNLAKTNVQKSINIYEAWLAKYEDKTADEIYTLIKDTFMLGFNNLPEKQKTNYLNRRIKDIAEAQKETKRRLSVSYTNLGVILRHEEKYEEAAKKYVKAVELWDRNLTAENNLNILLGNPLKKRNFIQKMFPTEK